MDGFPAEQEDIMLLRDSVEIRYDIGSRPGHFNSWVVLLFVVRPGIALEF